jgi:hypothetical protein
VNIPVSIHAQTTISGNVNNIQGESVPGATIQLKLKINNQTLHFAITDAFGKFSLPKTSQDSLLLLEVSHISYEKKKFT